MSVPLVITFTGPDRPGIVSRLARRVAEHGGNWEESRSASLAGRFAGILEVTVPEARAEALVRALLELESDELRVLVERGGPVAPQPSARHFRLELTGADHEGIVRDVTHVLAERGVNIEDLITARTSAPMSGHALFSAVAIVELPVDLDPVELERALEQLADDLVVQIEVRAHAVDE
jgi:glycine cleavage system regulatory protein